MVEEAEGAAESDMLVSSAGIGLGEAARRCCEGCLNTKSEGNSVSRGVSWVNGRGARQGERLQRLIRNPECYHIPDCRGAPSPAGEH